VSDSHAARVGHTTSQSSQCVCTTQHNSADEDLTPHVIPTGLAKIRSVPFSIVSMSYRISSSSVSYIHTGFFLLLMNTHATSAAQPVPHWSFISTSPPPVSALAFESFTKSLGKSSAISQSFHYSRTGCLASFFDLSCPFVCFR
jgi:hypothetical protein